MEYIGDDVGFQVPVEFEDATVHRKLQLKDGIPFVVISGQQVQVTLTNDDSRPRYVGYALLGEPENDEDDPLPEPVSTADIFEQPAFVRHGGPKMPKAFSNRNNRGAARRIR